MRPYLIAELGHNWAPDFDTAKRMVTEAAKAGADSVKIQIRNLPDDIPEAYRDTPKTVPWSGEVTTYAAYRAQCELTDNQIVELDQLADSLGVDFFASVWSIEAAYKARQLGIGSTIKIPSACITDLDLMTWCSRVAHSTGHLKVILSTGAATWDKIDQAMSILEPASDLGVMEVCVMQCTATYPCPLEHLNLKVIGELHWRYPWAQVGYSNHGVSIAPVLAAAAMGAQMIEVHVTLDRSTPGTDHAASFEFQGLAKIAGYLDTIAKAMGDGEKKVEPGEMDSMKKLRRVM